MGLDLNGRSLLHIQTCVPCGHLESQRREVEIGISTAMAFNDVRLGGSSWEEVSLEKRKNTVSEPWRLRSKGGDRGLGRRIKGGKLTSGWAGGKGARACNILDPREEECFSEQRRWSRGPPGGASVSTARSRCREREHVPLPAAAGEEGTAFSESPLPFHTLLPCVALWSQGGAPSQCGQCLR